MIEIVKTEYVLTCDQCNKRSEAGEIDSFIAQGWHFDTWNCGAGYKFHALTCSIECRYAKLHQFAKQQWFTAEIELIEAIHNIAGFVKYPERGAAPTELNGVIAREDPRNVFSSGKKRR